jgi:hypothetical protein
MSDGGLDDGTINVQIALCKAVLNVCMQGSCKVQAMLKLCKLKSNSSDIITKFNRNSVVVEMKCFNAWMQPFYCAFSFSNLSTDRTKS